MLLKHRIGKIKLVCFLSVSLWESVCVYVCACMRQGLIILYFWILSLKDESFLPSHLNVREIEMHLKSVSMCNLAALLFYSLAVIRVQMYFTVDDIFSQNAVSIAAIENAWSSIGASFHEIETIHLVWHRRNSEIYNTCTVLSF